MPDGSPLPPTSVRRQALLPAGLAPLYLSREEAAAYVGVSVDTFIAEVREGWWPEPVRRGGREGRITWYRPGLELAAQTRHRPAKAVDESEQEAVTAAEAEAIKRLQNAKTRQQRRERHPAKGR